MIDEAKDPLVGRMLGTYQLVEPLGQGGMATVYKAYEAALDRFVAVKVLPPFLSSDENFIQRFRREAKVIAQLNHPNIVSIYGFGEEENSFYIAMQLAEGGALQHTPGQIHAPEEALRLLTPIARALGYAHQRGIIHRDVKPGNILLAKQGWAMLVDFGLARAAGLPEQLTLAGETMGTPQYMSPEQAQGREVDHRTDIYSLGIILYEFVTGDSPFHADTPIGVMIQHITDPVPRPRQVNPQIPETVEQIILKAAAKNPAERFQSGEEMAEAMESALGALTAGKSGTPATMQAAFSTLTGKGSEKRAAGNPFTFGNPIKDPARFIGRETEIRQIVNRLLTSAHESTSIIGERRIGKTSLLSYLSDQEIATGLGLTPDQFCLIYVDFQGLTDITPQRFWQRVLKKMARSVCDQSLLPAIQEVSRLEQFDLFDLEDLFEAITDKGLTTVLFMDEFEYVTQNPNFKSDFFGGLRALAIHHGVALVPATRRELVDLCHSEEIKGSPFFNIFANVALRPFSRSEVDEMICRYLEEAEFSCSPEEQDFIWKLGGGYPFFVQMAGHYLWEGKLQNLEGTALAKFAADSFDGQAEAHFTYLWSHCSESEKITLLVTLLMGLQKVSKKTIPNAENLARLRPRALQDLAALGKRGVINEREGVYKIFSPAFERWIQREIMAAPGEEEDERSADEWLKAGGQQDIKHARGVLPGFKKKYWQMIGNVVKDLSIEFAANGAFEIMRTIMIAAF